MEIKWILQIVGVCLGLLYLWLEYRADIRLWVVGLIMPIVHGSLYLHSGLYADAGMQLYYILAGLYGWWVWWRGSAKPQRKSPSEGLAISHIPWRIVPLLVVAYGVLHAAIYGLLVGFTDSSVPFWDSFTTALCIIAYWLLSRKYVEQWLVWLAVDVTTVGLYLYKGIPLTAGLYALYSLLAVAGYLRWRKEIAR